MIFSNINMWYIVPFLYNNIYEILKAFFVFCIIETFLFWSLEITL